MVFVREIGHRRRTLSCGTAATVLESFSCCLSIPTLLFVSCMSLTSPSLSCIGPFTVGGGVLLAAVVSGDCDPVRDDGAVDGDEEAVVDDASVDAADVGEGGVA